MSILPAPPPLLAQKPPASRTVRSRITALAAGAGVALGLAVGAATVVVPAVTGGTAMTVVTGSMEPALPVGSVAVYRPVDPGALRPGDVIAYRPDTAITGGVPITHRVIEVGSGTVIVQGDANLFPDKPVRAEQIIGKLDYAIPYLGMARVMAHRYGTDWAPAALAAVLGASAVLLWLPPLQGLARPRAARSPVSAHVSR